MGIKIEWSEDGTKGTISKEDIEKLQKQFDNGFGKGVESGKKDIYKLLSFLDISEDNFTEEINKIKTTLLDLKAGKLPKEMMDKIKDLDLVKDLQEKLDKKSQAYDALEQNFSGYKRASKIDGKLKSLAISKKAISPDEAVIIFKNNYNIELDDNDKIVIKNANGNVMFDSEGNEIGLDSLFEKFEKEKTYLFEANGNGGSGGGGGGGGGGEVNPWKKETFNLTKQAEIIKKDSAMAERLKKAAG